MIKPITLRNGKTVLPPKNYKEIYIFKLILVIAFMLLVLLSIKVTGFSIGTLIKNGPNFGEIIMEMLPPIFNGQELVDYFAYSKEILPELIKTLQMAILGTFIGVIIAFPFAIMASANISNKVLTVIIKIILSLTRTMPVLIYAMIFTYIFGLGEFAGVVSIVLFTFGIVAKMLYENIEKTPMGAYEAATASGLSRYNAFNVAIIPQILPAYFSLSLYSFEINVRSAVILGYVGAGGIGQQLNNAMSLRKYSEAGLIILYTIILVILIDLLTQFIRRRMI